MRIYTYNTTNNKKPTLWKRIKKGLESLPWRRIFTWLFRLGAVGILAAAALFIYYSQSLPDPNRLINRVVPESTKIFAKDGTLLYEIHGEVKRTLVGIDDISPSLRQATVAIEDKDFYNHSGISVRGLLRSVYINILNLDIHGQGGSTITQQFVKNALLTREKAYTRKLKEIILSIELEARFSKDEILQLYLNEIPYGRNTYGAEAASLTYFAKPAKELSLAESAYLAAIPQSPTYYNPSGPNRDALDRRKDIILEAMRAQGYISEEQMTEAKNTKVTFQTIKTAIKAPHFVLYVENYLAGQYGEKTLQEGGLKVYTTLDAKLQDIAERAVSDNITKTEKKYNNHNAALVAIDPKTGQILAMVGSKDYFGTSTPEGCKPSHCLFDPQVNAALSDLQPGSSFKPYAYVTAFKKEFGYAPASMLVDVNTAFSKSYQPRNYDFKEHGPVSMRQALAGSLNIPAVKTLALVGVDNVVETAHDLGITSPLADCGLSLVLGGCEVKLLDHVASYATLANGGNKHEKTAIVKIEDKEGRILEEFVDKSDQVIDPEAVYALTSIMIDNAARAYVFGTNSPLTLKGRSVAAKTGTTQEWHDGWTMGFTPSLAAGVWTGNNDGTKMSKGADGVYTAAPIWHQFMEEALQDTPVEEFVAPAGITKVTVAAISGKLPTEYTPDTKIETFQSYAVPKEYDPIHVAVAVDKTTGLPAGSDTLPENIVQQAFKVLHSERPSDPAWETPVKEWAAKNGYLSQAPEASINTGPETKPIISIKSPVDQSVITVLPITVTIETAEQGIARIDIALDGEAFGSLFSPPYQISLNQSLTEGQHILTAHAVTKNGNSGDTSSVFFFGKKDGLSWVQPLENDSVNFPATLTVASPSSFTAVDFYYQQGNKPAQLIAQAPPSPTPTGNYEYSVFWQKKPPTGTYTIFAKTAKNIISDKITISVQ
jgi:1A family penicillin-binding protein